MAIFLVQHGLSASKDIDPQRGLTETGKAETIRIAEVAQNYGIQVDRIVHSGKKRAEETAAIYYQVLQASAQPEKIANINPLDNVRPFAKTLHPEDNLMVVGHLPYLERLVSYLSTGATDTLVYRFQNSGIVCLDREEESLELGAWFIKWTLNPTIA